MTRRNPSRLIVATTAFVVTSLVAPGIAAAQWQTVSTFETSAQVYVPQTQSEVGSGRALLVGLHGCVQSAADLQSRANLEASAEELGVVVALPDVPFGGVIAGCWDYYGSDHTRTNRHNGALLTLTETLIEDAELGIDADQVYVAGLSSGGGQAVVVGCLAPDVFAGVGIIAGPALGTEASQIATVATTMESAATSCLTLAGETAGSLDDQLAVTYASSGDYIVAQGYAGLNAEMYGELYGASAGDPFDLSTLIGFEPAGNGTYFDDADGHRVAWLVAQGQGHAWPAGSGPGPELSYVATEGIDFARFALEFFRDNNRRVEPAPGGGTGDDDDDDTADTDGDEGGSTGAMPEGDSGEPAPGTDDSGGSTDCDESSGAAEETGEATQDGESGGCRFGSPPSPLMVIPILYFAIVRPRRPDEATTAQSRRTPERRSSAEPTPDPSWTSRRSFRRRARTDSTPRPRRCPAGL